jgi:hypothetical protein
MKLTDWAKKLTCDADVASVVRDVEVVVVDASGDAGEEEASDEVQPATTGTNRARASRQPPTLDPVRTVMTFTSVRYDAAQLSDIAAESPARAAGALGSRSLSYLSPRPGSASCESHRRPEHSSVDLDLSIGARAKGARMRCSVTGSLHFGHGRPLADEPEVVS